MVSTRRSTAKANSVLADIKELEDTEPPSDAISNRKRPKKKVELTLNVPNLPVIPPVSVFSGNISDHGTNLISPAVGEVSRAPSTGTKNLPTSLSDRNIFEPHRRVPKPSASMSGSCQDPIVVNENSSPARPTVRPPKRKHTDERPAEPHRFMANGYKDLYNYGASRPAPARLPPKRSVHNSHQSHDIYKAMNQRATDTHPNHNASRGSVVHAFPFPAQQTFPVQTLAYQQVRPSLPPVYAQYYQYPAPPVQHYTITSQSEEILRKEVAGYIQEFSKLSPCEKTLSITNPREKKSGEAERHNSHHGFSKDAPSENLTINSLLSSRIGTYPRSEPAFSQNLQRNLRLHSLTKYASLLTSLLQIYPYSTDHKGLLEDIRAIASIQNHHMTAWLDSMSQGSSKQDERSSDSAIDLDTQSRLSGTQAAASKDKDKELKQVFAATAAIWQDGTRHSVADVFRARPSSPPIPSTATSPTQPTSHSAQRGEETEKAVAVHVSMAPMKQSREAKSLSIRTTISPTPSSHYSPIMKTSDSVPRG